MKCRHFENHGQCKFGDNCSYAHGDDDLRVANNNMHNNNQNRMPQPNNKMPQPNMGGFDMNQVQNMMNPMMYSNLQGMLGGDGNMNMMQN